MMFERLKEKIENRSATVGVIGLGYVGLPLVLEFSKQGFPVIGFDKDEFKVTELQAGRSYIKHITEDTITNMVSNSQFQATSNETKICEMDIVLI